MAIVRPIRHRTHGRRQLRLRHRPVILPTGNGDPFTKSWPVNVTHLWVTGLHFYNDYCDPNSEQFNQGKGWFYALNFRRVMSDLLIEDCKFSYGGQNINMQAHSEDNVHDVRVRRNVFEGTWTPDGGGHAVGIFVCNVKTVQFEGNVFDQNGWNEQLGNTLTMFAHSVYLYECEDVIIRNNIFARDGDSLKISSDHYHGAKNVLVENNLFMCNAIGLSMSHTVGDAEYSHYNITIRNNVFTCEGRTMSPTGEVGNGVRELTSENVTISNNLFLHTKNVSGSSYPVITSPDPRINMLVENNIVFDWDYYEPNGALLFAVMRWGATT